MKSREFRSKLFALAVAWLCLTVTAFAQVAPSIQTQPESQTATEGDTVTFTVVATGDEPLSYQWSKDGAEIEGATSSSLILTEVSETDAGDYTVVVSNDVDSVTSDPATLTVTPVEPVGPSITTQPESQTATEGDTVTFTVVATGDEPLSYQWSKDGAEIEGATSSSLILTEVSETDAGDYTVVVSNDVDSVTSDPATLTVTPVEPVGPAITTQPESQSVNEGDTVTFTVVATGDEPLSYQWSKDGAEIEGATSSSLILTEVSETDAGDYTVVVSNDVDSVTSDPATLTVTPVEPVGPAITTQPESQSVNEGDTVTFTVVATGDEPLSYQWSKDGAEIEGATSSSLILTEVSETDAGDYTVVVSNDVDSVTSDPATLTVTPVEPVGPSIETQPESQTATEGDTVTFTVVATGDEPLSYQWSKNDVEIEGATSSSLILTEVSEADTGNYTVVVSNNVNSVTSDIATLSVTPVEPVGPAIETQPESQTVNEGDDVAFTVVATGDEPLSYQWSKDGVEIEGATSAELVLTDVSETDAGDYTVVVTNEVDSITSDPATLTVTPVEPVAPAIETQPESQTVNEGDDVTFTVVATGTEPLSYQWSKDGAEIEGATSAELVLTEVSETDAGDYTVVVTNEVNSVTSDPATLTVTPVEPVAPAIETQPESQTVNEGDDVTFTVVATGTEPLSYQWSKDGAEIEGATSAELVLTEVSETDAGDYTVVVTNEVNSITSDPATLTVTPVPEPPVITTQPESQSVEAGTSATFTVVATGDEPLSYQWSKDGAEIEGATSAELVLTDVSETDAGDYTVVVTNEVNSATSDPATLTVTPAGPAITTQPESQVVIPGDTVTFTVAATGAEPLTYQWSKDGVEIEGATSAELVLADVTQADEGEYTVVVSNEVRSVTSDPATLAMQQIRIAWVSFHPADDMPSADAAAAGFTEAPDVDYTQLLAANGHTVERIVTSGTPDTNQLNNFDLVIISRSVPSGDYQDPPETLAWNGITSPTIIMGGYIIRNSRLGYTTGGTIPDTTNSVSLMVNDPDHPVFAGIELNETNTMVNAYADIVTFNDIVQRGISVNTDPVAGDGTVLATIATEDPAFGGLVIGEWQTGATMGNAAADTLGGHRLVFLSGSREMDITSQGAGIFDLTEDGIRMFLNAVNYMAELKILIDPTVVVDDTITITWRNGGMLETATEIDGEWSPTGNDTGSHTMEIGDGTLFFRVQAE